MLKFKNVLPALLATAMLAGCSTPAAPTPAPATVAPATPAPAATAAPATAAPATAAPATAAPANTDLKPAELTWYFVVPGPQPAQDAVYAEFNKKLKEKINATVDFLPISFGDYDQKLSVTIASGENYDVCFTSNWTNNYGLNAAKGAFAPLDDLLAKYAPKLLAQVPKDFWNAAKINGKIYGVVNEQVSARGPVYALEDEVISKYGFDTKQLKPYDLSSVEPFMAAIVKDYPKSYFLARMDDAAFFKQDFVSGWNVPGSVYVDDTGTKIFNQFESPEVLKYAEDLRNFATKGYMHGEERIAKQESDEDSKNPELKGLSIEAAFKPGIEVSAFQRFGKKFTYVTAGEPVLSTSGICATMQAINRNSKNPERAMMLLEIMNTDKEMYNLLNFGIKGTHFDLDSEGFMIPAAASKEYAPSVPWMFATNYMAYVDKGMPKDVWEQTKKMNAEAKRSPLLGFTFNIDPIKAEAGQCTAVIDEYYKTIEYGLASKEKYDEFVKKLKDAGSDKVIAEMQKQVDAWKAAK